MITDRRQPNRKPATWLQIINPIWWASDAERNHKWPWWKWFLRNPFCNFTMTVIGIADHERDCHYAVSGWTYAHHGWNYGYSRPTKCELRFPKWSHIPSIPLPRLPFPFLSRHGTRIEWAIGWKTSGGFTMQCRRANSPNATDAP